MATLSESLVSSSRSVLPPGLVLRLRSVGVTRPLGLMHGDSLGRCGFRIAFTVNVCLNFAFAFRVLPLLELVESHRLPLWVVIDRLPAHLAIRPATLRYRFVIGHTVINLHDLSHRFGTLLQGNLLLFNDYQGCYLLLRLIKVRQLFRVDLRSYAPDLILFLGVREGSWLLSRSILIFFLSRDLREMRDSCLLPFLLLERFI